MGGGNHHREAVRVDQLLSIAQSLGFNVGRITSFLDLGTGPGTIAAELANSLRLPREQSFGLDVANYLDAGAAHLIADRSDCRYRESMMQQFFPRQPLVGCSRWRGRS